MTNPLLEVIEELRKEEDLKKKPVFHIKKEKRLQYYSGWHKDDKPVDKVKIERQVILNKSLL